jgi:hypothetical protein
MKSFPPAPLLNFFVRPLITSRKQEPPMRELVGLIALLGALVGICLIWTSGDRIALLGLLLLIGAGLFLQYLSLSRSSYERYQLLSQQITRLGEQLEALQKKPMAEPDAVADRPREDGSTDITARPV